ncbi:MAG TPA: type III pantothenate kinase [Limnobacter sp.]|nr:type III pantothenate kinase [Limnobacter sp.]
MSDSSRAVLCIDAGNTLVKWCTQPDWKAGFLLNGPVSSFSSQGLKGQSDNWPQFERLLRHDLLFPGLSAVLLCSVLGIGLEEKMRVLCSTLGLPLHILSVRAYQPVNSAYINPASLGRDRWAATLAVSNESRHPVNLLVSFGTATTLDALVDQAGWQHLGGYIVPGVQTMFSSLHVNTAELPRVDLDSASLSVHRVIGSQALALPQPAWPESTTRAISEGVVNMQVAMVQACAQRLEQQFGQKACIWLTGGFASLVLPRLSEARILEHAVFRGQLLDYQLHREQAA